jgi:hypothetical protein
VKIEELNLRVWRGKDFRSAAGIATGFAALDDRLPGRGWPWGALTEILVDRYGIGELSLLMPALARLTRNDTDQARKWVAWISPPMIPYAPALQQYGVAVEHLLMIQPPADVKNRLWAVEQVVRSGTSSAVLAWLSAASQVALRRLQLAAEEQGSWVVLFRPVATRKERSPAALRIQLQREKCSVRLEILKCRGGQPGVIDMTAGFPSSDEALCRADWRQQRAVSDESRDTEPESLG